LAFICGVIVLLAAGIILWERHLWSKEVEEMKPYLTYTRLIGAAKDCDEYWNVRHTWPNSLAELREFRPDLSEWAVDMWGRDFILVPYEESLGYGRIISYGRDGTPGGSGAADQDIEVRFPVEASTNWNKNAGQRLKRSDLRIQ
jgi:hypothetical protein